MFGELSALHWSMIKNWVKVLALTATIVVSSAAPAQVVEINRLALSLDELVSQKAPVSSEIILNGKKVKRNIAPVELDRIVPIASRALQIEEPQIRELLKEDREKLSRIVYARLISTKNDASWSGLLRENGPSVNLLERAQAAGLPLTEIQAKFESLYHQLSFAALDSPLYQAQGAAPKAHSETHQQKKEK